MNCDECVKHITARLEAVVQNLFDEARSWPKGHWLYAAEHAARRTAMEIGRGILQSLIVRQGTGHVGHRHVDAQGQERVFKEYRTRQVRTLVGQVSVRRARYTGGAAGAGSVYPLDERLGLRGALSEGVEELLAFTGSQLTYEGTRGLIEKTLGVRVAESTVQETAEHWGRMAMTKQLPREVPRDRMAVAVDGAMIRVAERRRKRRGSRKQHFEERWTEAKLGVIYSFTRRGEGNSDKRYTASLEGKESFGRRLWSQIEASGADRAKEVAWLGDGAEWVWALKREHLPHAAEILDFHHAREHLLLVARALWGEGSSPARRWVDVQKRRLLAGRARKVVQELKAQSRRVGPPPKDCDPDDRRLIVAANLRYFEHNAHRMKYRCWRERGYPISSGVVESGCRHVIAQRMKITASMSWKDRRAEAILQLRCLVKSRQWDEFWSLGRVAA